LRTIGETERGEETGKRRLGEAGRGGILNDECSILNFQ
jgi:hypothetical protein